MRITVAIAAAPETLQEAFDCVGVPRMWVSAPSRLKTPRRLRFKVSGSDETARRLPHASMGCARVPSRGRDRGKTARVGMSFEQKRDASTGRVGALTALGQPLLF